MANLDPARALDRAEKLLAKSESSFEEEARTAALQCCKTIKAAGLKIVPASQVAERPPAGWDSWTAVLDSHRHVTRQCRELLDRQRQYEIKLTELVAEKELLDLAHEEVTEAFANLSERHGSLRDANDKLLDAHDALLTELEDLRVEHAITCETLTRLETMLSKAMAPISPTPKVPAAAASPMRQQDLQPAPMAMRSRDDVPRAINARYADSCLSCGDVILAGDKILWKSGVGSTHTTCSGFWKRSR